MTKSPINFLRGVPADEALQPITKALSKEYVNALNEFGSGVVQYATPSLADFNGFIPLKETLARRFKIQGEAQARVICSNGGMETFSVLMKSLPPNSQLVTDALTYDRVLSDAERLGHSVVGVPLTTDGINLDALRDTLRKGNIELVYQIGYHHNPTGLTTSSENLKEASRICAESGVLHVVDIAYLELRYDGQKNELFDIDTYGETSAVVGSFTKTISPGAKCGFGMFPESVVKQMTPVLANTRLNPNYPTQAAIHKLIESGFYDSHLEFLISLYKPRMDAANQALQSELPELRVPELTGGFFVGIWLKGIQNEAEFIERLKEKGAILAPAQVFAPGWKERYYEENDGCFFRLTFPALSEEENELGVKRIAEVYREMLAS